MSIRSERIKALIDNSDYSYQDLEKLTGIPKSSLQRYATGVTSRIPMEVFEKLSDVFNVPQEYLLGWDEQKSPPTAQQLSEEDREMLEVFKLIPADFRKAYLEQGRAFANSLKKD